MTPIDPAKLPVLRPPEPQAAVEKSLLARLLRYRFFLVALVIILFFAALFSWESPKGTAPAKEGQPLAALSQEKAAEAGAEPGHPGPRRRKPRNPRPCRLTPSRWPRRRPGGPAPGAGQR